MFNYSHWSIDSTRQLAINTLFELELHERRLHIMHPFELNLAGYSQSQTGESYQVTPDDDILNAFIVCGLECGFDMELQWAGNTIRCQRYQCNRPLAGGLVDKKINEMIRAKEPEIVARNDGTLSDFLNKEDRSNPLPHSNPSESSGLGFLKQFLAQQSSSPDRPLFGYDEEAQTYYFYYTTSLYIEKKLREVQAVLDLCRSQRIEVAFDDPFLDWNYHTTAMEYLLKRHGATECILDRQVYDLDLTGDANSALTISLMAGMDVYLYCESQNLMFHASHNGHFIFVSRDKEGVDRAAQQLRGLMDSPSQQDGVSDKLDT